MGDIYNNPNTAPTFDHLLGGRWHTGFTHCTAGQIDLQHMLVRLSGMKSGLKVLDWGCGNGNVTRDYARMSGATVYGLTNNSMQYAVCMENVNLVHFVHFVLSDTLDFPDGYFDIVVFTESVCHVRDKAALFREFHRVLRKGGKLVGEDWMFKNSYVDRAYSTYTEPIGKYMEYMRRAGFSVYFAKTYVPRVPTPWDYLRSLWYNYKYPVTLQEGTLDYGLIQAGNILPNKIGIIAGARH